MWPMLALTAGSALLGAGQANQQRKAQAAQNEAAAEQTRYSPWTGMGAGQTDFKATESGLQGAARGGLGGFMSAQSMGDGMGSSMSKPSAAAATTTPTADGLIAGSDAFNTYDVPGQMPQMDQIKNPLGQYGTNGKPGFFNQG